MEQDTTGLAEVEPETGMAVELAVTEAKAEEAEEALLEVTQELEILTL
tara:strand:+ start:663 stop:806 length:144 start_codon:yes stop_codon:yes gene_type:complete